MAHHVWPTTLGAPLEAGVQDSPAAAPAGGAPADGLATALKALISVPFGIAIALIALFLTTGFTVPTRWELESMTPEEKDDRRQYWVAVLGGTYIAIVVVGTVVMYMGSRVAGKMMRARDESRDKHLWLWVVVMFLPYYLLLTSLTLTYHLLLTSLTLSPPTSSSLIPANRGASTACPRSVESSQPVPRASGPGSPTQSI